MAYWDTRDSLLDRLETNYDNAEYNRDLLAVNIENAIDYFQLPQSLSNLYNCVGWMLTCLTNCKTITYYLIKPQGALNPPYDIIYFLSQFTGVTYKSIVNAWLNNDFEGRFATIATIDRMRQIMWNEHFTIQWAQRPEDKYPE